MNWREFSECRNHDPELWFPNEQGRQGQEQATTNAQAATEICRYSCPVQQECARHALDKHMAHGVWGGVWLDAPKRKVSSVLDELSVVAGVPAPSLLSRSRNADVANPTECSECHRKLRKRSDKSIDFPGTIRHRAAGMCDRCYEKNLRVAS